LLDHHIFLDHHSKSLGGKTALSKVKWIITLLASIEKE